MERCPEPRDDCKYPEPFTDDHHEYWPSNEYRTPTEKRFRQLECNILRGICRCIHEQKHREPPPKKPPVAEMRRAVYGHE